MRISKNGVMSMGDQQLADTRQEMKNVIMCQESEMPRDKCHKEVHAIKIENINPEPGGTGNFIITPSEHEYSPITVPFVYMQKHNPYIGGYYVVYSLGIS